MLFCLALLIPWATLGNDAPDESTASDYSKTHASEILEFHGSPELKAHWDALIAANTATVLRQPAKWENVLLLAKAIVAKYPQLSDGYYAVGNAYENMGFADDATSAYQQAVKINPQDTQSWTALGVVFKERGKVTQADFAFSKAIAAAEQALATCPKNAEWACLETLGNTYRAAGNLSEAERTYLSAIDGNPRNPSVLSSLARLLAEREQFVASLVFFERLASLDPGCPNSKAKAYELLASFLYDKGLSAQGDRFSILAGKMRADTKKK
jgi:tetratricopeptide (TPR) repeat protein